MNFLLKAIFISITIVSLFGAVFANNEDHFLGDNHKYFKPSLRENYRESDSNDSSMWKKVSNFFSNIFKTDEGSKALDNNPENGTRKWSEVMREEMREIFDSVSTMWRHTVDNNLKNWRSYLPNNETLQNMKNTYDRSITNMNEMQKELQSLWDGSVSFVSLDNSSDAHSEYNRKNIWQTLESKYNEVSNRMAANWHELDLSGRINASQWFPTSMNGSKLESAVLQLQQQLNDGWEQIANRIAGVLPCNGCDKNNTDTTERMNRIQRDVQQLWNAITGGQQEVESTNVNDNSIHNRVRSVLDSVRNYYKSKGNGSAIDGIWQSAQERVSRIGNYFRDLWQSGKDTLSDTQQTIQQHRDSASEMVKNLRDIMTKVKEVKEVKDGADEDSDVRSAHDQIEREE